MSDLTVNEALEQWIMQSIPIDIPKDQAKYVFCLMLAYPLAFLFSLLPNSPALKHTIGLSIGVWFGYFIMGSEILHSAFSATCVYAIMRFGPSRQAHKLAVAFAILYMSAGHIQRMYNDYLGWRMDFSGVQLLLTIKYTTFAFDWYDGQKAQQALSEYQKGMCVRKFPSILEWFGYIYFFPGFLTGPAFNYGEYNNYINLSMFKETPTGRAPFGGWAALKAFLSALVCAGGVMMAGKFPVSYMRDDEFYNTTTFLYRFGYLQVATALCRFPYYFAWIMSEGACNLAGLGFSGYKNGVAIWERATNVWPLKIETAQNYRAISEHWNVRTDRWLKHYVYERVGNKGTAGLIITFMASAVWHGFYPGYYFSFATAALHVHLGRVLRRNFRSRFVKVDSSTEKPTEKPTALKPLYDVISWVISWTGLNYNFAPFMVRRLSLI
eukprot:TRINITY_DN1564_c0_g2_i2.p1 TRINITY_DN1564_c0_g2~~TRINITY_DN1564_c0_g2_i2.p1  ORF type:complete len:438 (+),score=149.91 TRINITY_DN1564_c0_g2_i2:119-1432(+)